MAPSRQRGANRPPAPKHDRLIAMLIWAVTGLLVGFAIAIFIGSNGWVWLAVGLGLGLLAGVFRTRPPQQIEQD